MKKVRKEDFAVNQAVAMPPPPLPENEKKRLVQAQVNLDLFKAVYREMKRKNKKLKIRQVIEWGLGAYLLTVNPKEAARLGVKPEMP